MVVWPCIAEIIPNYIFNDRNPLICGVKIVEGVLKIGCPISLPSRSFLDLGRVIGMEINNKPVDVYQLVSKISRQSLDLLKQRYGKQLTQDDIQLLVKLKKTFNII
ncbi:Uncharacterized protein QTN25_010537 [Entamoeba marina]